MNRLSKRMRWVLTVGASFALIGLIAAPAAAQSYSFSVPELKMQVYIQPDGSARIVYDITFENGPFARAIDVVDIGTPHAGYNIGNMSASIDGARLTDIRRSEYVDPGVEVHLGSRAIQAGQRGTLHFEFTMPDMVYQDVTRPGYASLQITPTWFGSEFVTGATDIWIAILMLPGIQPEEMLYQTEPFTAQAVDADRAIGVWRWEQGRATGPNLVGISFPDRGMTRIIRQTVFDLAVKWLEDNPTTRLVIGGASVAALGFLFFRFSGGTGISVFAVLACGLVWLLANSAAAQLLLILPLVGLVALNEGYLRQRRRRYLPAIAQVEGGGIKRGLTAPEAAVLLEMPLNKVLTLVIFGLLKKGVLGQAQASPLVVEVDPAFVSGSDLQSKRAKRRQTAAQEKGIVLHDYEGKFIDPIEDHLNSPVHQLDFSAAVKGLIESAAARMKGFDLSDTQDYYRGIIRRALVQAQSIGEIPQREKALDRDLEWILLDERYPTVLESRGYTYWPVWSRPATSLVGRLSSPPAGRPAAPGGRTSFGDVAAGFAGWVENTAGSLASAIAPGSLQVAGSQGGVINLRGADKVTGDIFKALAESSSGRSGGGRSGGGCACACAGCACACACAGGGR